MQQAPRFWSFATPERLQALDETISLETRVSEQVKKGLAARGIKINDQGPFNYHTGSIQIVWRGEDGKLHGAADPRRLAHAQGH